MRNRTLCLIALAGSALGLGAQAQPSGPLLEPPPDPLAALLDTPVIAASRRSQKLLESPQAIEVLTASQIRASGVFRLIDVLKLMTGVQVFEFGKERAFLSIRGTTIHAQMKNVLLLVDGVPLFNTVGQTVPFDLLPLPVDAIERVEVVRGPSSSLYGANAQVGVVAITTRKGWDGSSLSLRGGAANGATSLGQGYFSQGSPRFNLAAAFGGSSQRDSGLSERVLGSTRRVDSQDQNHASQVFLRPEVVLGGGRVWAMYGRARNQTGPQVQETDAGVGLYQTTFMRTSLEMAQLGWSQPWSQSFHTELKVNRSHLMPVSLSAVTAVPGSPTSVGVVALLQGLDPGVRASYDLLDTTTEQMTLQGHWSPPGGLHLVFGLDAARLDARKTPIAGLHADREDSASGGFLSVDWTRGSVLVSLGARLENETLGGSRTNPRASLVYRLPDGSVLRGGYFTSTRSPQVSELVQNVPIPGRPAPLGNLGLKPETVNNLELGYRKAWAVWSVDLTAYHMTLRKAIGPQPTGLLVGTPPNTFPQTQFGNGKASLKNQGLEASLRGEPSPGWQLGFNAAAVDFKDEAGLQQFYSPRFKANLWSRCHLGAFQAHVALQHLSSYRIVSQADIAGPREETPSRLQVHFHLSYELGSHLQVAFYGINAARPSDESTAGSINSGHLIRASRREVGLQASYRY